MIISSNRDVPLDQGSANVLSRGQKNERISLGGPQLLSKQKHSAHFNIVLLYLSKNYASEQNLACNNMESELRLTQRFNTDLDVRISH